MTPLSSQKSSDLPSKQAGEGLGVRYNVRYKIENQMKTEPKFSQSYPFSCIIERMWLFTRE
jgi:hypothetical protein